MSTSEKSSTKILAAIFAALAIILLFITNIYQYLYLGNPLSLESLIYDFNEFILALFLFITALLYSKNNFRTFLAITLFIAASLNLYDVYNSIVSRYFSLSMIPTVIAAILFIIAGVAYTTNGKRAFAIAAVIFWLANLCYNYFRLFFDLFRHAPYLFQYFTLTYLKLYFIYIPLLMLCLRRSPAPCTYVPLTGAAAELKTLSERLQHGMITPEEYKATRDEIMKRL